MTHVNRMSVEELQEAWAYLIEQEEEQYSICVSLGNSNSRPSPEKAEAERNWWMITNAMLWLFVIARVQSNHELQPFPKTNLLRLANIAEELGNGIVPVWVEAVRKPGRVRFTVERRHIAYAVLYLEAVARGELIDRSPTKTIAEAYRVEPRTVQRWRKDREALCLWVAYKHLSPEALKAKMLEAAAVYSRIGRGAPSSLRATP